MRVLGYATNDVIMNVPNHVAPLVGIDVVTLVHPHVATFVLVVIQCVTLLAKLNAKVLMGSLV